MVKVSRLKSNRGQDLSLQSLTLIASAVRGEFYLLYMDPFS
jgi:hypothetical protein